jgi:CRP-like cAMP-binding protein
MNEKMSFENKKFLVSKQLCFKVLNDEELKELTELFVETHYAAGDVIVTEGEIVDSVFIIVSGVAEVQHVWVDSGVIRADKLAELGPNQAIGLSETGIYSLSGVRTATVVAKSDMMLLRMNVTKFNGFVLSHSNVAKVLREAATKNE